MTTHSASERTASDAPRGVLRSCTRPGRIRDMDENIRQAVENPTKPQEQRHELKEEAKEAKEGDKKLDDYDKTVADSFPASDPPTQP